MTAHLNFSELNTADAALARRAQALLRASETLDWNTARRLDAARGRALAAATARPAPVVLGWRLAPAAALVLALVGVWLMPAPVALDAGFSTVAVNRLPPDALEWVADEAGPGFYRDLEFYQWLEHHSPPKPNA